MLKVAARAVADAERATAMIRARAGDYAIDPNRIVFVGFSSGAHVAAYMGLNANPAARANYVAPIYGAPFIEHSRRFLPTCRRCLWSGRRTIGSFAPTCARFTSPSRSRQTSGGALLCERGPRFRHDDDWQSSDVWPDAFFNSLRANGLT